MNAVDGDLQRAMTEVTHDARGALGTIRLALTALLDDDLRNDAVAPELLRSADTEAARLVADLAAMPVLVDAYSAVGRRRVDLGEELEAATNRLRAQGVDLQITVELGLIVETTTASPGELLSALLGVAAARGGTKVVARAAGENAVVYVEGADLRGRLVDHLLRALGGESVARFGDDGFGFDAWSKP